VTRLPASGRYRTLLIPDAAVNADQNERYLLVVGAHDIVQRRLVKLGALFAPLRSITRGLKPGEWVIVDGMQSAAPGVKVNPQRASIPDDAVRALVSLAARSSRMPARRDLRPLGDSYAEARQ
jgi:hypothetical protein